MNECCEREIIKFIKWYTESPNPEDQETMLEALEEYKQREQYTEEIE